MPCLLARPPGPQTHLVHRPSNWLQAARLGSVTPAYLRPGQLATLLHSSFARMLPPGSTVRVHWHLHKSP